MRHAGIHWPDGPEPPELWTMPGITYLLLDSEARWHYDALQERRPEALLLWRSIAVPPASVKMSARRYADAVLLHWGEQQGQTDLVAGNEWNLNYERGDGQDDWDRGVMAKVYQDYGATFASRLRQELRGRVAGGVRLHYPAWAPGHFLRDFVNVWAPEADQWDAVDFHAYGSLAEIQAEYDWFRAIFPSKRLCLTEWHGRNRDDVQEELKTLAWLAATCQRDQLLLGACFFIWRWQGGKDHTSEWDIEGNPARLALFGRPPVADQVVITPLPSPAPQPEPPTPEVPQVATLADLRRARWAAVDPTIPYNPDTGIAALWLEHPELGSALTPEVQLEDGTVGQAFACGIICWTAERGAWVA